MPKATLSDILKELKAIRKLLTPKVEAIPSQPVNASLKDLIAAGNFQYVNSDINDVNFPDIGEVRGAIELYNHGKYATTKEIEDAMDKKGLRPANLRELLEYAKKGWDGKTWCVALGSSWMHPGGVRHVPYLYRGGASRRLRLYWDVPGSAWYEGCRFVAIKKV